VAIENRLTPNTEKENGMKRTVLSLAALVVIGLATGTALAGPGHCGSYYGPGNGYSYSYRYDYGPTPRYYSNPHLDAVRRIQATHSRYRYHTHSRSNYNSPPYRYDYRYEYRGW